MPKTVNTETLTAAVAEKLQDTNVHVYPDGKAVTGGLAEIVTAVIEVLCLHEARMSAMAHPAEPAPCDVGGDYWFPQIPGPAVYRKPCGEPPTHRYREPGMVEGFWGHRCTRHAQWLDAPGLVIEPFTDSPR